MNEALLFLLKFFRLGSQPDVPLLSNAVALPQRLSSLVEFVRSGRADSLIRAQFKSETTAAIEHWRGRVLDLLKSVGAQNAILFAKEVEKMRALSDFNDRVTLKIAFEAYINEGKDALQERTRAMVNFDGVERETVRRVAHVEALILFRLDEATRLYIEALLDVYSAPGLKREEALALAFSHMKSRLKPLDSEHKQTINQSYAQKRDEWLRRQ